jgi:hypothetical protein
MVVASPKPLLVKLAITAEGEDSFGDAPAFVKSEGPMCEDCPVWRTELVSPAWNKAASGARATEK